MIDFGVRRSHFSTHCGWISFAWGSGSWLCFFFSFFFFSVAVAASGLQNSLREAKSGHIFMNSASSCPALADCTVCDRDLSCDLVLLFSLLFVSSLLWTLLLCFLFWEGRYRVNRSGSALNNFFYLGWMLAWKTHEGLRWCFLDEWPLWQKKQLIWSTSRSESQKSL